jgi:hypothetical protein
VAKKRRKVDDELLVKLDSWWNSALTHPTWVEFRKNATKCHAYKESDQWTKAELKALDERGQPPTVNNQVAVTLDRLTGQFVKTKTRLGFRGRNPQDVPGADALTDVLRFIRQNNDLEFEEREMADDGLTSGFGCLEVFVTFDDLLQPRIRVCAADTLSEVFPDPYSRKYDWNEDAEFVFRAKWLSFEEASSTFPEYADDFGHLSYVSPSGAGTGEGLLGGVDSFKKDNYIDFDKDGHPRRIRIVECWYKKRIKETLLLFTDEQGQRQTVPGTQEKELLGLGIDFRKIERSGVKMRTATFTQGILLVPEKEAGHGNLYPLVPYFVHRKKSGEPYSMIFTSLPIQDAINKRESKAIHLLNNNQSIYEEGVVENEDDLAIQLASPDGQVKLARNGMEKFHIRENIELAATQFSMHQESKADYRRVTGVNPDAMGERSEIRSGVGVARKQQMTDLIVAPVFDNLRRTRVILSRVLLEFVRSYMTEPSILLITDDLRSTKEVHLSTDVLSSIKQGTYDVVAEDMPDTTTLQQEQAQMFFQVMPELARLGPAYMKMGIELTDLRNKEELIKVTEAMLQAPPPEAKVSLALQWDALTAPEKIAWATKLGMPELAQAIQADPQPTVHETKADTAEQQVRAQVAIAVGQQQVAAAKAGIDAATKLKTAEKKPEKKAA